MDTTDTLKIAVEQCDAGVVIYLSGSASMDLCDKLNQALLDANESKPAKMVIDLENLEFICSLGLGGLVAAYLRARKHNGVLCLASPSGAIREMLEVTKLAALLPVYDTPAAAFAAR